MIRQNTDGAKEAYDQLAGRYDSLMAASKIYRNKLWTAYRRTFRAGEHIIDLGCGTGTDSMYLAGLGCRITALDISPNMLAQFRNKLMGDERESLITIMEADIDDLSTLDLRQADGVVSGFAAINTVNNLKSMADALYDLLNRHGRMILHGLNVVKASAGNSDRSGETPEMGKTRKIRIGDIAVPHFLISPEVLYENYFREYFELTDLYGMGMFYSLYENPAYPLWIKKMVNGMENFAVDGQTTLERGRFFVFEMQKRWSEET